MPDQEKQEEVSRKVLNKLATLNFSEFSPKGIALYGSICYNYKEFDQAIDLLGKKKITVKPLIGEIF